MISPRFLLAAVLAALLVPAVPQDLAAAPPSILYQAGGTHGWAGWSAPGWVVQGGALVSTGQRGEVEIRAPYIPGRRHKEDYTVDATIELLHSPGTGYRGVEARRGAGRGYRFYSCCAEGNQIGVDALKRVPGKRTEGWTVIALGSQPELNADMEYELMLHGTTLYANAYGPGASDFATARHLGDTKGGWVGLYAGAGTQIRVTCFAVTTWTNPSRPCALQSGGTVP
jgi:hypothetical protein